MKDLKLFADEIRYYTIKELNNIGYGHFGGSLSIVDALAALYGSVMKYDPANPQSEKRDYFILSKGHGGPAYYATLALSGFFPMEELYTLNANGTNLPSHPDRNKVKGVDMTTGSLGQGISVAAGLAYRLKSQGKANRVYCIVGDGELNEGQCWEAAQFIAHNNLNNLVIMVDDNKKQLDGYTCDICDPLSFVDKFKAFGFNGIQVDGNDPIEVEKALLECMKITDKPTCIVLDTVKGAGVEFVETTMDNHHMRLDEKGKEKIAAKIQELEERIGKGGTNRE